jgi:hypothetical protein
VGVRLPRAPAALAIGPVHLDHGDLVAQEVTGESRPVAAGPFDADELESPEALQPGQQVPVTRGCGGKALDTELGPSFVEGGRHVGVEVRVDPSGDLARDSGHCHLFFSLGVGDTAPTRRWTGQRWACAAGSYEVTPSDRLVSGECPSQADESTSGQSERTSAGIDGVRPGSGIHPHADQFSLRSGGPSAGYVNPRCRLVGMAPRSVCWVTPDQLAVEGPGVGRSADRRRACPASSPWHYVCNVFWSEGLGPFKEIHSITS